MSIVDEIMAVKRQIVVEESLEMIEKAYAFLDERQTTILDMRLEGRTLEECSQKIRRTRNRISQIAKEARDILKLYLETDGQFPYLLVCFTKDGRRIERKTVSRQEAHDLYRTYRKTKDRKTEVKVYEVMNDCEQRKIRFF